MNQGSGENMEVNNLINTYKENSSQFGCDTSESGKVEGVNTLSNTDKTDISSDVIKKTKENYTQKELDDALKKINNFLKDEKTHAEYSVHKDFGTLMIKIVDDESDEVVLEIPPEKILDMVASMCRQVGLLDKKA